MPAETVADDDIFPIYCRKCKKVIARDAAFCPACGYPQGSVAADAPQQETTVLGAAIPPPRGEPTVAIAPQAQSGHVPGFVLTLFAFFSPLGCIVLPAALIIVLGLSLFLGEAFLNFWPVLLGVVIGIICLKQPQLSEQNRVTALLVSLSVGTIFNILILTAPR